MSHDKKTIVPSGENRPISPFIFFTPRFVASLSLLSVFSIFVHFINGHLFWPVEVYNSKLHDDDDVDRAWIESIRSRRMEIRTCVPIALESSRWSRTLPYFIEVPIEFRVSALIFTVSISSPESYKRRSSLCTRTTRTYTLPNCVVT